MTKEWFLRMTLKRFLKMKILSDCTKILDSAGTRKHDCVGRSDGLSLPFGEFRHGERFVNHPAGRLREEF